MRRFQKILVSLNILWVILTFLSYLAPFINPQSIWQFNFIGLAYPSLLIGNIGFLIIWGLARKKIAFLSLVFILLGWNPLTRFLGVNLFSTSSAERSSLSVMTYNMHNLSGIKGKKKEASQKKTIVKAAKQFLIDQKVDVLALQEISAHVLNQIQSVDIHPYRFGIENNHSFIVSAFPFGEKGGKQFDKSGNSIIWADIKAPTGTVRMVNIHLQSNHVSQRTDKVLGEMQEEFNWKNIRPILATVKYRTTQRVDQAGFVKTFIDNSPFPVILCGDFNDTPQSYIYHLLKGEMKDAFAVGGWGIGSTYAGKIPGLKIDHIFYHTSFEAVDCEVEKVDFSDHYPVTSRLVKKTP